MPRVELGRDKVVRLSRRAITVTTFFFYNVLFFKEPSGMSEDEGVNSQDNHHTIQDI